MATTTVVAPASAGQDKPDSQMSSQEGSDVSLIRTLLRQAIDESGWKQDAVACAIGVTNGAYLSQMLSGEKPISAKHLRALPDDIEAIFAGLYAESFGLIVVAPDHGPQAVKNLVSGLIGLLSPLPERARMVPAALPRRRSA